MYFKLKNSSIGLVFSLESTLKEEENTANLLVFIMLASGVAEILSLHLLFLSCQFYLILKG